MSAGLRDAMSQGPKIIARAPCMRAGSVRSRLGSVAMGAASSRGATLLYVFVEFRKSTSRSLGTGGAASLRDFSN